MSDKKSDDGLSCGHRGCAIRKMLVFIKIVSERSAEIGLSEDRLLEIGLESLNDLGASKEEIALEEIALATIDLVFNESGQLGAIFSPLVSDIDNDSPVASGE